MLLMTMVQNDDSDKDYNVAVNDNNNRLITV